MTVGASHNARNTMPQTAPSNQYNLRIDHQLGSRDFLWGRYTWGRQNAETAQSLEGTKNTLERPAANAGLSYTHIVGSNSVWNSLFGYSSLQARELNLITSQKLIQTGVFKGMPIQEDLNAPSLGLSGFSSLSSRIGSEGPMKGWQARSDYSTVVGSHAIKFGGEMVREPWDRYIYEGGVGFSPLQTADLNNPGNTGYDVASFVLGVIDNRTYYIKDFAVDTQLWNAYIQDSWKVNQKLTLNAACVGTFLCRPYSPRVSPPPGTS